MVTTRIDHQLAAKAATAVPPKVDKELQTRLAGLPAMIMTSGLAATGAFLLARDKKTWDGKPATRRPYRDAAKELLNDAAEFARIKSDEDPVVTLDTIAREPSHHRYLIAEARARLFATWLARFAAARAPDPTPGKGDA